jgi:hypothetical protein
LYISHDKGLHWTISPTGITPVTDGVNKISFKDEMNGLVAQTNTTVVLRETHDGGATWQTITSSGPFLTNDMGYVPGTDNTFVTTGAATGATGASFSFDGGHSWSYFIGTEADQFLAVDFVNNHCGWAGGFSVSATDGGMNKYVGLLDPSSVLEPISNLLAETVESTVTLTWTAPSTLPLSYNVYRNDTLLSNTTSLQYQDLNVYNGAQTYCVSAVYDLGESSKACTLTWIRVGVKNYEEDAYVVYPNPASEVINIVSPVKFKEVRMLNSTGKLVYSNNYQGKNLRLLTEGFAPGMYILQINNGTRLISKKISISK